VSSRFSRSTKKPPGRKKKPTIQTIMMARLSADRRVVDEATAALFLSVFAKYLKQPELLML
jgi:pyruvate dehydrogenase E2 component (dihydrolipoamide acetyltransferase)